MKIKNVYVECKKSKNFQTYTCGETIEFDDNDDVEMEKLMSAARCRKMVQTQISLDSGDKQ